MNKAEPVNPLLCDPATGLCELPSTQATAVSGPLAAKAKPVRLIYFTDPICSSCWGIEPQLRKLKMEYGDYFEIEYHMGGLLKGWDVYGGKDVSGAADVAAHWDEASARYDMPIDGNLWLEDPLESSYPPSIAFKAAQLQGKEKALQFLRRIKEMIFLEKKNISRWNHIEQAAKDVGLDAAQLKTDMEGRGKLLFEEDLQLAKSLNVRGFPTIFFTDKDDNRFLVYGSRPYEAYEEALLKLYPSAVPKEIDTSWKSVFKRYPTLTTKEFATLTGNNPEASASILEDLQETKQIKKHSTRNGDWWSLNRS